MGWRPAPMARPSPPAAWTRRSDAGIPQPASRSGPPWGTLTESPRWRSSTPVRRCSQEVAYHASFPFLRICQTTWSAFWRTALDGAAPAAVAAELGISPNAVHIARSRVLARLREEARGFVDLF